jgi:hypothetical protein
MLTVGTGVMVTEKTFDITEGQFPEAGTVYVMLYVPAALALGVIVPVVTFKASPAGVDEKEPPVYAPVPFRVTNCGVELLAQYEFEE